MPVFDFLFAILAITNPVGKVPLWIEASRPDDEPVRRRVAILVVGVAFLILAAFLVGGKSILAVFGVDVPAFRIGGGVVIGLTGLRMLRGEAVDVNDDEADGETAYQKAESRFRDVAVPLTTPVIAGPGSITTVILYGTRASTPIEYGTLLLLLAVVMGLVLATLLVGHRLRGWVGDTALDIQSKLFGLILVAIAAQLAVDGLAETFPGLTHAPEGGR